MPGKQRSVDLQIVSRFFLPNAERVGLVFLIVCLNCNVLAVQLLFSQRRDRCSGEREVEISTQRRKRIWQDEGQVVTLLDEARALQDRQVMHGRLPRDGAAAGQFGDVERPGGEGLQDLPSPRIGDGPEEVCGRLRRPWRLGARRHADQARPAMPSPAPRSPSHCSRRETVNRSRIQPSPTEASNHSRSK